MIEIGNNVIVSGEVMFITHDGAIFTALDQFPDVIGRLPLGGLFRGIGAHAISFPRAGAD